MLTQSHMTKPQIKQLLLEDLENKQSFNAQWRTECDGCGVTIEQGDPFIFMGDKKKICNDCQGDIEIYLES